MPVMHAQDFAEAEVPNLACELPTRLWQMSRPTSLADVHHLLNQLAPLVGHRFWVVQVEDWRTLARARRYTMSNHPRAWTGPAEVAGAFVNAAFAEWVWSLRAGLPAVPEGDESLTPWPDHLASDIGRGFSVRSRFATSDTTLSFVHGGCEPAVRSGPEEISGDLKLFSMMVHTLLLPILTQVYVDSDSVNLSRRELTCLQWAARGKTAGETAALICLSEHTVNFHMQRAINKLNASNRSHAVAIVVAMGLVRLGDARPA